MKGKWPECAVNIEGETLGLAAASEPDMSVSGFESRVMGWRNLEVREEGELF